MSNPTLVNNNLINFECNSVQKMVNVLCLGSIQKLYIGLFLRKISPFAVLITSSMHL